jgi:hypothetical protein
MLDVKYMCLHSQSRVLVCLALGFHVYIFKLALMYPTMNLFYEKVN